MGEEKATLLIVEDDPGIADMLNAYFRVQGYDVNAVNWGEDGLQACFKNLPDLVILDIRLPDIDGFEVARRLRADRRTKDIPIIFLTEKRQREDRLRGLELSADDYITKPFDIQELRLRVRNTLRRCRQVTLNNPVTGLPEGRLVYEQVESYLDQKDSAFLIVSIKNIGFFREVYGFVASDDLLRAVSLMLKEEVRSDSSNGKFLGHLTATDFLVITRQTGLYNLKKQIQSRLEKSFSYFYREQDKEADVFGDKPLTVVLNEVVSTPNQNRTLEEIRLSFERYIQQV